MKLVDLVAKCTRFEELHAILKSHPAQAFGSSGAISASVMQMAKLRKRESFQPSPPSPVVLAKILAKTSGLSSKTLANLCYGVASGRLALEIPKEIHSHLDPGKVRELSPQHLCNMLWSFALLGQACPPALFPAIKAGSLANLAHFNYQDIATLLWSLASLNIPDRELFAACQRELLQRDFATASPQSLSNILWSFASVRIPAPELFARVGEFLVAHTDVVRQSSSQALGNVLWSFATLERERNWSELLACLQHELGEHRRLSALDVSNAVWGFASLRFPCRTWACIHLSQDLLRGFSPTMLARVVWGLANEDRANQIPVPETEWICRAVLLRPRGEFNAVDVSMISWALATMQQQAPWYFETPSARYANPPADVGALKACATKVFEHFDDGEQLGFTPTTLCNTLWAYSSFGAPFPSAWVSAVPWRELTSRQVATVLQSCALMQLPPGNVDALCQHLTRTVSTYADRDLSSTLWSLACLDLFQNTGVQHVLRAVPPICASLLEAKDHEQLLRAKLAWDLDHPSGVVGVDCFALLDRERAPVVQYRSSNIQQKITQAFADRFATVQSEHVLPNGLVVDLFVNHAVAVEVDGPTHFQADGRSLSGSTAFKRRLLERSGVRCLSIHVQDYVNASKLQQQQLLDRLSREIR